MKLELWINNINQKKLYMFLTPAQLVEEARNEIEDFPDECFKSSSLQSTLLISVYPMFLKQQNSSSTYKATLKLNHSLVKSNYKNFRQKFPVIS